MLSDTEKYLYKIFELHNQYKKLLQSISGLISFKSDLQDNINELSEAQNLLQQVLQNKEIYADKQLKKIYIIAKSLLKRQLKIIDDLISTKQNSLNNELHNDTPFVTLY